MKRATSIVLAASAFATGCVTVALPEGQEDSELRTLTGWITFNGEVRLYDNRDDLGILYGAPCWSVVLSRKAKQSVHPEQYEGRQVVIRGDFVPAIDPSAPPPAPPLTPNYCNRDNIIILESISIATPPE